MRSNQRMQTPSRLLLWIPWFMWTRFEQESLIVCPIFIQENRCFKRLVKSDTCPYWKTLSFPHFWFLPFLTISCFNLLCTLPNTYDGISKMLEAVFLFLSLIFMTIFCGVALFLLTRIRWRVFFCAHISPIFYHSHKDKFLHLGIFPI